MAVLSANRNQATRQTARREMPRFVWKRSWNLGLLLLVLLAGLFYLSRSEQVFPVNHFEVFGELQHQDKQPIGDLLDEFQGQGFFGLPIHHLKYQLQQLPWVESAAVQRVWPDTLRVNIVEKTPMARWDESHLLSSRGDVFPATVEAFGDLPLIYASTHSPGWAMKQFFDLNTAFAAIGEQLVALRIDSRAAFELQLRNGLVIKLGREQIGKKVNRLVSIYQREILPRKAQIEQLDLRYSNGFAVKWKAGSESQDKASTWSDSNV